MPKWTESQMVKIIKLPKWINFEKQVKLVKIAKTVKAFKMAQNCVKYELLNVPKMTKVWKITQNFTCFQNYSKLRSKYGIITRTGHPY